MISWSILPLFCVLTSFHTFGFARPPFQKLPHCTVCKLAISHYICHHSNKKTYKVENVLNQPPDCVLLVSSQTHGCILGNLCNGLVYFRRVLQPDLRFPAVAISPSLTLFVSDPGLVVGQGDIFPIYTSSFDFSKPPSGVQNEPRLN